MLNRFRRLISIYRENRAIIDTGRNVADTASKTARGVVQVIALAKMFLVGLIGLIIVSILFIIYKMIT